MTVMVRISNKIIFLLIFFFLQNKVFAQDFLLAMENRTGLMSGLVNEYVYRDDKQISRLEWDIETIPYIDTILTFSWKWFFAEGSITASIPANSGSMRNHDYLLPDSTALTNFSEHTAFLDRFIDYSLSLGFKTSFDRLWFISSFGFQLSNRKWTARDGYYQNANFGSVLQGNEPINNISGDVVTYEQKISYFFINISPFYHFTDSFRLGAQFMFYPHIWAESIDHHIIRRTEFYDVMHGGIGGSIGIFAGIKPFPIINFEFVIGCTYEKLFKQKGSITQRAVGINSSTEFLPTPSHTSGYDSELWRFFIGTRFFVGF